MKGSTSSCSSSSSSSTSEDDDSSDRTLTMRRGGRRKVGFNCGGQSGPRGSLFSFVNVMLWALVFNYAYGSSEGCPTHCKCIWKQGKETVECENQNLSTLPEGIDPATQVLNISGNRLQVLPRDAFQRAGLVNLQKIYLRGSKIRQIDPGAFNELINVVEIDLSDNLLTNVPTLALKQTKHLRELNLAGNPFVQIHAGAFEYVKHLVRLDLSRSQLVRIDDDAFSNLGILESLKITSNQLSTLSNYTVNSISHVQGIDLHDNPWDCDCRLRFLRVWLESKKISHPASPICHTPVRLSGRRFADLSSSEFACPPKILMEPSERFIRVFEGENATMECITDSMPVSSIQWYSQRRLITNNMGISAIPHRKFFVSEDEELGRSVLTLTNALQKDSGDFVCVVENSAGFTEANFTLEVLPPPPLSFQTLEMSHILIISLGLLGILLLLCCGVLFTFWRRRTSLRSQKPPEILASSTPIKPPRLNYDMNPGSLVPNGYSKTKADSTDNPDLILETNNGPYQENGLEEQSSNSELNWEQQSYRNMGYATEYPADYGLPIIHENSVYSENVSYYGPGVNHSNNSLVSHGHGGSNGNIVSANGVGSVVMSGVWSKNKVGTRIIRAPSARDSPDEGYQEGYCGTDV